MLRDIIEMKFHNWNWFPSEHAKTTEHISSGLQSMHVVIEHITIRFFDIALENTSVLKLENRYVLGCMMLLPLPLPQSARHNVLLLILLQNCWRLFHFFPSHICQRQTTLINSERTVPSVLFFFCRQIVVWLKHNPNNAPRILCIVKAYHITLNEKKNGDIPGVFTVSAADYELKYVSIKQYNSYCTHVEVCRSMFLFL